AMGPKLLLLLLLRLVGQGSTGSLPELLQAPKGSSILVQCHYRLQDVKAQKVWCQVLPEGCQPLVTSAVNRGAPAGSRVFLTDLGGGLLQVEMLALREEDAGEYACVVEGLSGPQTVHRVTLDVLPAGEIPAKQLPTRFRAKLTSFFVCLSRPWIWGAVFLLGLLVMVAVVLLAVMAPSSAVHHISDSGLAVDLPSDVPYVKLDSPPSFDDTTYTNLPPDPLSGKLLPLEPPSVAPLPPKVEISSKPVTYATVIFPGKGKSGEAAGEPAQEPPNSQAPPS
uniref:Triggering receptor expressed on myeloid cells like 1 n=1 Tax=Capra hircus TaxID=9925 RepID=A0A452EGG7_CAPHI